jgi:hypothetical protein
MFDMQAADNPESQSTPRVMWYRRLAKLIGVALLGGIGVATALGLLALLMRMGWFTGEAIEMGGVMGFAVSLVAMEVFNASRKRAISKKPGDSGQSPLNRA